MIEMLKRDKIERELEDENVPGGVFFIKIGCFIGILVTSSKNKICYLIS